MANWVFNILLGLLVIVSYVGLLDMRKASKRLDRNADLFERHIKVLEQMEDDVDDNGIRE